MITPVNGHLLIEPVKHESFMASQKGTYEEIGVVVAFDESLTEPGYTFNNPQDNIAPKPPVLVGDRVYFDSWLAAKYPKNDTEFYWLVKWEDVRAIEHAE